MDNETTKIFDQLSEERQAQIRKGRADALARRKELESKIYYAHPKYGRFKEYPTSLSFRFRKNEVSQGTTRILILNWINANIQGLWSVDQVEKDDSQIHTYHLSFSESSDALLFKLTWGHEQAR